MAKLKQDPDYTKLALQQAEGERDVRERNAEPVLGGVKKAGEVTAGGIGKGAKETAGGLRKGAKETTSGIGKAFKSTGHFFKKMF